MRGVNLWVRPLRAWSATPGGRKAIRYLAVSVMNVVLGEAVLGLSYLFLHWSAQAAAIVAVAVSTVPAYFLNRMWVWGRSGRSHLVKEVIPFWVVAFVYLVLSVGAADTAEAAAKSLTASRPLQTMVIMGAILLASGVLWLLRYFVLDTLIFSGAGVGTGPGSGAGSGSSARARPLAGKAADARG
jgi:putative flippase GtrA